MWNLKKRSSGVGAVTGAAITVLLVLVLTAVPTIAADPAPAKPIQPQRESVSESLPGPGADPPRQGTLSDCQPIDFSSARLEHRDSDFLLLIEGTSVYAPDDIQLVPVMYVMMPDYWQMSLVGCRQGKTDATTTTHPYAIRRVVNGSLGHKGIRLLGATPGVQLRIELTP